MQRLLERITERWVVEVSDGEAAPTLPATLGDVPVAEIGTPPEAETPALPAAKPAATAIAATPVATPEHVEDDDVDLDDLDLDEGEYVLIRRRR
jgi:hypothetical protein